MSIFVDVHYHLRLMSGHPERLQVLAGQFEELVESLNNSQDLEHRKRLLRHMKILIDKIDALTLKKDTASSLPPDQATGD
jgi:hypothetical protein